MELVDRLRERGRLPPLNDGTADSWSTEALCLLLSSGGGGIEYDDPHGVATAAAISV